LHPFALIQKQPVSHEAGLPTAKAEDYASLNPDRLQQAYRWLNDTFKWRPVFDRDSFVNSNSNGDNSLRMVYSTLRQQFEPESDTSDGNDDVLLAQIAKQFQYMRECCIPVHIPLGRRHIDTSSLYWGWPYNATTWNVSLRAPLNAGLGPVAAYINTLSIFYDLRNPLDERHLQAIDERQPYQPPDAKPQPSGQRMANGSVLGNSLSTNTNLPAIFLRARLQVNTPMRKHPTTPPSSHQCFTNSPGPLRSNAKRLAGRDFGKSMRPS
jgi:hypothetical protein